MEDQLEKFRIAFHLFRVSVEDDRLIYKTTQPKYSASAAKELIRTLGLDLKVEIPSDLPSANTIVIIDPVLVDEKRIKAQMTLEVSLETLTAA